MSRRRNVYPGQVLFLSRRTTRRHYLFSPDSGREVEQLFWYALAYAAQDSGVLVHAACLMSTHWHLVVTDVRGCYPKFLESFDRMLALGAKALRGWPGEVFDKRQASDVELTTPKAVLKEIAYTIGNPASSFAVRFSREWPGARTSPGDLGRRTVTVRRPAFYFAASNPQWPAQLELDIEMPAAVAVEYGEQLARQRIERAVRDNERSAWAEARHKGLPFLGARRVLKQPHTRRARSYEEFGARNPRFSAAGDAAAAADAVRRFRLFDEEYDLALRAWQRGNRAVAFPHGTWWMRVHHRARCHPPPT